MSDYSALDRTLHRIILGPAAMGEILGDIDAGFSRGAVPVEAPVFVTGLARAGTTVLMRALHASSAFASLTYADMPMVMAPNLWARISRIGRKERVLRERAHGDGVMVDFDAPEALEEVFWRTHAGRDYIRPDGLVPHQPDADMVAAYRGWIGRICHRYGKVRYLAKNNNLLLRLAPLAAALPQAVFLVPVRDPLAQAASLRAQHARFAHADRFTADYMRWLVHHEFGPDQRPYVLPGQPVPDGPRDRIDYWLTLWLAAYGWIEAAMSARPEQIRPVVYEALGRDPEAWSAVARLAGLPPTPPAVPFRPVVSSAEGEEDADPALLERARSLYAALAARAAAPAVTSSAAPPRQT